MVEKKLELLVIEDNEKHLADAISVTSQYVNIHFTFVRTLEEAEQLIEQKRYDAVVIDVFFPVQEGGEPTSDSGLSLAKRVDEQGIPFVYNTSGNHHGRAYSDFLSKSKAIWNNYGFGTGKMIEAYPKYPNTEKDTKQWNATINYAILLARSNDIDEKVKEEIGALLDFASYGDYGELTETMQRVLTTSLSSEEMAKRTNKGRALEFIKTTLAGYSK